MDGETILNPLSNYYGEDKIFNGEETIPTDNKNL